METKTKREREREREKKMLPIFNCFIFILFWCFGTYANTLKKINTPCKIDTVL